MTGRCSCCGVRLLSGHNRCAVCGLCDGRHGDVLQAFLLEQTAAGKLAPGTALARAVLDDALLSGRLHLVPDHAAQALDLWIPAPVPRWLVVIGRACARGEQPNPAAVLDAATLPYKGAWASPETLTRAQTDITQAALALGLPAARAAMIRVRFDESTAELTMDFGEPRPTLIRHAQSSEIPDDIMSRPRGQA